MIIDRIIRDDYSHIYILALKQKKDATKYWKLKSVYVKNQSTG